MSASKHSTATDAADGLRVRLTLEQIEALASLARSFTEGEG